MIIKKGFFTKVIYQISDGIIQRSEYAFFGLKHKKNEDYSLNLNEVEYIYNINLLKGLFPQRKSVELVSQQDSIYIPNLKPAVADELVKMVMEMGAIQTEHKYLYTPSKKSMRKITHGYTILCDQFDSMVRKVYNSKEVSEDRVNINSIVYFDDVVKKRIKGIAFGRIAGGGSANTIEIYGLTKSENEIIRNMIQENNPKLTPTDVAIYKSFFPLFSPSRWFKHREQIMLTDWGLLHKQYGVTIEGRKFASRTSAIEYNSIKSYLHRGFLFKHLEILGNTTILTKERYSVFAKNSIWRKFKQLGIRNQSGDVYRASLFHRKNQGRIITSDDNIYYKHKQHTFVLKYSNIYSYEFKKPHWYSLFGDVTIRGRRIDARAGEGGDVQMEITHMWFKKGKRLMSEISYRK